MDLNKVMIIGRMTKDPELKTTPKGQSVVNFSVATNRSWTDPNGAKQGSVEYHNAVVWGKLADICAQYLHKGKKVYLEGRLQTRDWEGQDGVKRKTTEVVVADMIMLDSLRDSGSGNSQGKSPLSEPTYEETQEAPVNNREEEVKVEDIPF